MTSWTEIRRRNAGGWKRRRLTPTVCGTEASTRMRWERPEVNCRSGNGRLWTVSGTAGHVTIKPACYRFLRMVRISETRQVRAGIQRLSRTCRLQLQLMELRWILDKQTHPHYIRLFCYLVTGAFASLLHGRLQAWVNENVVKYFCALKNVQQINYLCIIFTTCRRLLGASSPDPYWGYIPGLRWGTFVLRPLICPPLRAPMASWELCSHTFTSFHARHFIVFIITFYLQLLPVPVQTWMIRSPRRAGIFLEFSDDILVVTIQQIHHCEPLSGMTLPLRIHYKAFHYQWGPFSLWWGPLPPPPTRSGGSGWSASALTHPLYHSRLKAYLFHKIFSPETFFLSTGLLSRNLYIRQCFTDMLWSSHCFYHQRSGVVMFWWHMFVCLSVCSFLVCDRPKSPGTDMGLVRIRRSSGQGQGQGQGAENRVTRA